MSQHVGRLAEAETAPQQLAHDLHRMSLSHSSTLSHSVTTAAFEETAESLPPITSPHLGESLTLKGPPPAPPLSPFLWLHDPKPKPNTSYLPTALHFQCLSFLLLQVGATGMSILALWPLRPPPSPPSPCRARDAPFIFGPTPTPLFHHRKPYRL
jgi:hypothetical protein